jgi:hypothetical protein
MKEHVRKIKSLPPPRPSPASQSLTITPTPPAATITTKRERERERERKKIVVEATKIHPHRHTTKSPSIGHRSAHLNTKFRKHQTEPSKRALINSHRASTPLGVTCVHCGAREIKKRAFVWL